MIRQDSSIELLLRGQAEGRALVLCCDKKGAAEQLASECQSDKVGAIRFLEPCRVEHPHSAFLRKPAEHMGRPAVHSTLYAPDGKLTELRFAGQDGAAIEHFIKKPGDFQTLRSYFKDIEQYPPANIQPGLWVAQIGMTPNWELESRWAGAVQMEAAKNSQDESAASCLRKLDRLFRHRCEEAARQGGSCLQFKDLAACPPISHEAYMKAAASNLDWVTRHAGLPVSMELPSPEEAYATALCSHNIGIHTDMAGFLNEAERLPQIARYMIDFCMQDACLGIDNFCTILSRYKNIIIVFNFETNESDQAKSVMMQLVNECR